MINDRSRFGARLRSCIVALVATLAGTSASAQYVEDFESYPASSGGTTFTPGGQTNSGGWFQWDGVFNEDTKCFTTGGPVAAHGGTKYIGTQLGSDTIRTFTNYFNGHRMIRYWTYVAGPTAPMPMQAVQWAVVMADYNNFGPYIWAVQIRYDPVLNQVSVDNGYGLWTCTPQWGSSVPIVYDAWKETRIDVDIDVDVARVFYDGMPIGEPFRWSQGPFGNNGGNGLPCPPPSTTFKWIECIDLYSGTLLSPSYMYWDDFTIETVFGPPLSYCTPTGGSTNNCIATITASANPNTAHSNSCLITASNLEGQKSGIVFYGLASLNTPWCTSGGNSLLCVKSPTMRAGTQATGGTVGACDGTLGLDWNAFQLANPSALGAPWMVGEKAYVQGWFRDPPSCKTTFLTQALELTYVP
jgi:hypothetical protein